MSDLSCQKGLEAVAIGVYNKRSPGATQHMAHWSETSTEQVVTPLRLFWRARGVVRWWQDS